jgi:hypothetical protein
MRQVRPVPRIGTPRPSAVRRPTTSQTELEQAVKRLHAAYDTTETQAREQQAHWVLPTPGAMPRPAFTRPVGSEAKSALGRIRYTPRSPSCG